MEYKSNCNILKNNSKFIENNLEKIYFIHDNNIYEYNGNIVTFKNEILSIMNNNENKILFSKKLKNQCALVDTLFNKMLYHQATKITLIHNECLKGDHSYCKPKQMSTNEMKEIFKKKFPNENPDEYQKHLIKFDYISFEYKLITNVNFNYLGELECDEKDKQKKDEEKNNKTKEIFKKKFTTEKLSDNLTNLIQLSFEYKVIMNIDSNDKNDKDNDKDKDKKDKNEKDKDKKDKNEKDKNEKDKNEKDKDKDHDFKLFCSNKF